MKMMCGTILVATCAGALAMSVRAETALVRIGYPQGDKDVRYETRTVELEKTGEASWRFAMQRADIPRDAKCVEFGGRPIFYTYKFADVPRIKKAWDEFVPVRHLQRELMTEHRMLSPEVFLTAYGDGSKTVCNYNASSVTYEGVKIEPFGYALFSPDGTKRTFAFDKDRGLCEK